VGHWSSLSAPELGLGGAPPVAIVVVDGPRTVRSAAAARWLVPLHLCELNRSRQSLLLVLVQNLVVALNTCGWHPNIKHAGCWLSNMLAAGCSSVLFVHTVCMHQHHRREV
jgi:hypothetical protein